MTLFATSAELRSMTFSHTSQSECDFLLLALRSQPWHFNFTSNYPLTQHATLRLMLRTLWNDVFTHLPNKTICAKAGSFKTTLFSQSCTQKTYAQCNVFLYMRGRDKTAASPRIPAGDNRLTKGFHRTSRRNNRGIPITPHPQRVASDPIFDKRVFWCVSSVIRRFLTHS